MNLKNAKLLSVGLCVGFFALLSSKNAQAQYVETVDDYWNFENEPNDGWWLGGHSGYDTSGLAHSGNDNIWLNNYATNVWNSANVEVDPNQGDANVGTCEATAWLQTSSTLNNASWQMIEDKGGGVLVGLESGNLSASTSYAQMDTFLVDVGQVLRDAKRVLFVIGFWSEGTDQWMRIDDVSMVCWVTHEI